MGGVGRVWWDGLIRVSERAAGGDRKLSKGRHELAAVMVCISGGNGDKKTMVRRCTYIHMHIHKLCMYVHTYVRTYVHTYIRTYISGLNHISGPASNG